MSLRTYNKKRDFKKTAEPKGKKAARQLNKEGLRFVVQEHHASHLHYDFRLELDGALKSWAVPKGPPTEPKEKRLAVEVEDHPVSYIDFTGDIPKGQYGGGHVEIWDHGTWRPKSKTPLKDLKAGRLEFELEGDRLRGVWMLVRTHMGGAKGKNNWLLIKRSEKSATRTKPKPTVMPTFVEPQLATLVKSLPRGGGWVHEIKFDGYRTLARIDKSVQMNTRNGLDWTKKYPEIAASCRKLKVQSAMIDGEIAAIDKKGASDFGALQDALKSGETAELVYYVFDLLFLDGEDLRDRPLLERKELLHKIVEGADDRIVFSSHGESKIEKVLADSCAHGLEGIISKRAEDPYESGRGDSWIKSKCAVNEELLILGYTDPKNTSDLFGALLMGAHDKDEGVRYVGRVGTGFDRAKRLELMKKFKTRATSKCAVDKKIPDSRDVHWLKPDLIAQVRFGSWTKDRILRHAAYLGLREDKAPIEVTLEGSIPKDTPKSTAATSQKPITIAGVKVTHPNRVVYPESGVTKRELAEYHVKYATPLLRYLKDRPLSLLRCTDGIGAACFFQKHLPDSHADSLHTTKVDGDEIITVDSVEGLISLIQMGSVEIHAWGSRSTQPDRPDQIVFDLDPSPGVDWKTLVKGAFLIKDLLENLKLTSFVKLSGGKGVHIHVPIDPIYTWDEVKLFSRTVGAQMKKRHPDLFTVELSKVKRKGLIFIDYLRNSHGATSVAPYSVRAREGAAVSMPIAWKELKPSLKPDHFKLRDLVKEKKIKRADPWAKMSGMKQKILTQRTQERGQKK